VIVKKWPGRRSLGENPENVTEASFEDPAAAPPLTATTRSGYIYPQEPENVSPS